MAKYYLLLALTNIISFSSIAQTGTLSGIMKSESGTPVSDANVVIKSLNRHVLTDESGRFVFPNIVYGKYEIIVNSIEIVQDTFHVQFLKDSNPVVLIVEPSVFSLNEVVVSTKTEKRKLETAGFAVSAIEPGKVAMQSLQTSELLDRTAGIRIRQDGGLGSRINYNINGLSGDAIKIFIDGVPASNFGAAFSLNNIPPALIERIEVYKGVVPGYLSEDALGGAVNVVLKQKARNALSTSYSIGSFNTHQWNINGSYRAGSGLTVDASAFYNYSDNSYKVWGPSISFKDYTGKTEPNQKARRFHDAYESYGTKINVGFTSVGWADRFLVGGVLSKGYKEVQHGSTMNKR